MVGLGGHPCHRHDPGRADHDAEQAQDQGQLRVGHLVRVTTGSWSPGEVKLWYQWQAGSAPIPNRVHNRLPIASKLLGRRISVRITVDAVGYQRFKITVRAPGRVRG